MMLVPMAGGADQRSFLETQRSMAFLATHNGVTPDQRKSRNVVIEGYNVAPVVRAVASVATIAEFAVVAVIPTMIRGRERRCGDDVAAGRSEVS
jgi:hypothetical protein